MNDAPAKRATVLVVDDEPDIQLVLRARLEAAGYKVNVADSGLAALSWVRESPPDIILLDLMLPGMDGLSVCAMLKRDQRYRHIPVVILTARSQLTDRQTGIAVGADHYLTKPFMPEELLLTVRRLLESRDTHGQPTTGAAAHQASRS